MLISAATRAAAGDVDGVKFRDRGSYRVRNLSQLVHIFAAVRRDATGALVWIDPVCRMALDPSRAAGVLIHEEVEYHFCSLNNAHIRIRAFGVLRNTTRRTSPGSVRHGRRC